jgi:rhodanese-related sulfurtransferase
LAGRRKIMADTITRDDLKGKIDRGEDFTLVETLPTVAYHHAHLPGAINIPPGRVGELASQLLPDKSAEIVVYCASPT